MKDGDEQRRNPEGNKDVETNEKAPYRSPRLVTYGDIRELTLLAPGGKIADNPGEEKKHDRLIAELGTGQSQFQTIRYQILNLAGRIVESGRQFFLALSDHYQFQDVWQFALKQLAKLAT